MKYHEFKTLKNKGPKRVGRGIAAGQGKTAGRGTKGQGARAGANRRPGFAGGQNPLMQKLPKLPGFRSFRVKAEVVYTGQLNDLKSKLIDNNSLAAAGLISNSFVSVKLLVKGEVNKTLTVKLQAASAAAVEAVQKAGGSFEVTPRLARSPKKTSQNKS